MPAGAGVSGADRFAVFHDVRYYEDLGIVRPAAVGPDVGFNVSEAFAHGDMPFRRQLLVPKKYNLVLEPEPVQLCECRVIQLIGEMHAPDFGAQCGNLPVRGDHGDISGRMPDPIGAIP